MRNNASINNDSVEMAVTDIISRYTKKPISLDSEIYSDLGIYGDDLYEIFDTLIEVYGTDYSQIDASKIAPGEGGGMLGWIARNIGLSPYKSFKVKDLIEITSKGASNAS